MSGRSKSYKEALLQGLQDDDEAMLYLQTAMEDSQEAFLIALRNVVDSRQTTKIAHASGLNREHLYRMLSAEGDPRLSSLDKLLHSMNLKLTVERVRIPMRDGTAADDLPFSA